MKWTDLPFNAFFNRKVFQSYLVNGRKIMKWIDDLPFNVFFQQFFSVILSRWEENDEMDR